MAAAGRTCGDPDGDAYLRRNPGTVRVTVFPDEESPMAATAQQLREAFDDARWPMTKDEVVAHAEKSGDDAVVNGVRGLPLGIYTRLEDVLSGIDTPDTPDGNH